MAGGGSSAFRKMSLTRFTVSIRTPTWRRQPRSALLKRDPQRPASQNARRKPGTGRTAHGRLKSAGGCRKPSEPGHRHAAHLVGPQVRPSGSLVGPPTGEVVAEQGQAQGGDHDDQPVPLDPTQDVVHSGESADVSQPDAGGHLQQRDGDGQAQQGTGRSMDVVGRYPDSPPHSDAPTPGAGCLAAEEAGAGSRFWSCRIGLLCGDCPSHEGWAYSRARDESLPAAGVDTWPRPRVP